MMTNKNTLQTGYILKSPLFSYRIERVIGMGGFGITYLAQASVKVGNVPVKVYFAIKEHFMSSDCEREPNTSQVVYSNPARLRVEYARKDFISEARRLQKVGVDHRNIVKVNEVFEANNTAYYVMEYLDGESLRSYVKKKEILTEEEMLAIMNPIIKAVKYLHSNRMTHLDIKPDNIMIVHDEKGKLRPVLIDFGLSKHYDKNGKPTSTVNVLGCSDGYAPIEQYAGITEFSPTADYYAIGATMWFCLMGKDPKKASELIGTDISDSLGSNISYETKDKLRWALSHSKNIRRLEPIPNPVPNLDDKENHTNNADSYVTHITQPIVDTESGLSTSRKNPKVKNILMSCGIGLISLMVLIFLIATRHKNENNSLLLSTAIEKKDSTELLRFVKMDSIKAFTPYADLLFKSKKYKEAAEIYEKAANLGDAEAQNELGLMYDMGDGVEANHEKAVILYTKSANQGLADAQNNLGLCYWLGEGVEQNLEEAYKWFSKAAEQNHMMAESNLGLMYHEGKGIDKDYSKALEWYGKAADQNYAEALCMLGVMYYNGEGVKKDHSKAMAYYNKAAEQDHVGALIELAKLYISGKEVPKDYNTALELYTRAAEQGNAFAQRELGLLYELGNESGIGQNLDKAVYWYVKAADQGDAPAQFYLGLCYADGTGVEQNYTLAAKYYRKAAEQDYSDAQNNLGILYQMGEGVPKDYTEAKKWYTLAAKNNHHMAKENLNNLITYYMKN